MPALDVGLLLEIIQQYSFLYDKKHSSFKDIVKKNNAWKEIAETLNSPAEDVKTRWRMLRERFCKELKFHEDSTRSGKCFEDTCLLWEWFEPMKFLKNHVKPRKTCSSKLVGKISEPQVWTNVEDSEATSQNESNEERQNFEPHEEGQYFTESEGSVPSPLARTVPARKRPRACETKDVDLELLKTLKQIDNRTEDEDDIFGKLIACELRKVSNIEEKQRIKAKLYMIATGLDTNN